MIAEHPKRLAKLPKVRKLAAPNHQKLLLLQGSYPDCCRQQFAEHPGWLAKLPEAQKLELPSYQPRRQENHQESGYRRLPANQPELPPNPLEAGKSNRTNP